MKHNLVIKSISFCLTLSFVASLLYSLSVSLPLSTSSFTKPQIAEAQTAMVDDLKSKINSHANLIKQLEEEIAKYNQELDKTSAEAKTLQNNIRTLELNSKKLSTDISLTEKQIDSANLTIQQINNEISLKEQGLHQSKKALAVALRRLNQSDSQSLVEALFSYENLSEFWTDTDTIVQFQSKVKEHADELKVLKAGLEQNKSQKEKQRTTLTSLKSKLADQRTIVEINKEEKNKVLTQTKNKEEEYKKLIADKQAKKKAFEQELRKFESDLKIAIDPNSIPNAKKGILAWPVDKPVVTQEFGDTEFARSGGYNGNGHNGIDLRATVGTPIKAALDGVVQGVGDTDKVCPGASYGKWILIRHNNGLSTLYAHNSLIKVTEGQSVSTGDIISYAGNTGYATGPHLHFTVYATQGVKILSRKSQVCGGTYIMPIADLKAYLNPLQYL